MPPRDGDHPASDASTQHTTIETRSLTESVREHVVEGGFRYHAYHAGKYPFPNDSVEQQCDEMRHELSLVLCEGKAFYAPVGEVLAEGGEVLDLGTGTGAWCMHLADEFPTASIQGLDLSPIQPDYVPPNVQFLVDDIEHENGWDYPENHFDFIHIRHALYALQDAKGLIERAYKHLKPGGYLEIQEFHYTPLSDDDSITDSSPYRLADFLAHLGAGLRALGSDLHAVTSAPRHLHAAGFSPTAHHVLKCPLGSWPRPRRLAYCGDLLRSAFLEGLGGYARRPLVSGLGWTAMQVEMLLVEVRRAVEEKSGVHAYIPFHVIYGQKPLAYSALGGEEEGDEKGG